MDQSMKSLANQFVIDALKIEMYNVGNPIVGEYAPSVSYKANLTEDDRDIWLMIGKSIYKITLEEIKR